MSEPNQAHNDRPAEHPHGYTLADEEMERLEEKRAGEDVLDPIALNDPVGMSVEKFIGRALVFVVFILVVGILFAQVACKNIQLLSVASFDKAVDDEQVEKAVTSGVSWAGEIVKFPALESSEYDSAAHAAHVVVTNDSARTLDQLLSASQSQAFTLAMAMFENDGVEKVAYGVCSSVLAPVDDKVAATTPSKDEPAEPLFTIIWQRGASGEYTCEIQGYDEARAALELDEQE